MSEHWKLMMRGEYRRDGHGFSHEYREPLDSEVVDHLRERRIGEEANWCANHKASIVPELGGCGFDSTDQCDPLHVLVVHLQVGEGSQ